MKTIKYLLFALLATFVAAGCSDDVTYTPGEGDQPGTYGVYFPSQATTTTFDLDPTDPTKYSYTIKRTNSVGAINVPVVVEASKEGIFKVGDIRFADGQTESSFTVDFSAAEIGTTYTANIRVADKAYAAVAGQYKTGLDLSVIRAEWVQVKGANGETTGKWRDEFMTAIMGGNVKENGDPNGEKDVVIWERADKPGYYRIKDLYDQAYVGTICGIFYSDFVITTPHYTIIDATDKSKVWLPAQTLGCWIPGYLGDSTGEWMMVSLCEGNYPELDASKNAYGKVEDGVITFPNNAIMFTTADIWEATSYYLRNSNITRIMLPGAVLKDYSVTLTKGEPVDGVVKIGATFGKDVAKVKYTYFEGTLSDGTASLYANDMADGKTDIDGQIAASGTINVTMEKTGVYTIVCCNYDKDGSMKGYSFLPFGYIKAGETKPVVLSVRTELTWEAEAAGHTPENSIKGILFGEEIESGYYGLVKTSAIAGKTEAELTTAVKGATAISAANLAKINATGWAPLFTKLEKGTSYTLLVWVYNGYYGKLFTVEQATQGDPSPLDIIYAFTDAKGGVPKADLFNTTWNYYAVDIAAEKTSREYLGKVTFSENAADGTDNDGNPVDYINITGLSTLKSFKDYTGDDTMKASWSSPGLVYPNALSDLGMLSTYYATNFFMWEEKPTGLHTVEYALVGVYVDDGIIAFVPNDNYVALGYTFTGMYFGAFSDAEYSNQAGYLTIFKHLMLINPKVDPNGEKAAAIAKTFHGIKPATNYVELRGPALAKVIWNEQPRRLASRGASSIEGTVTSRPVTPVMSSFTEGFASRNSGGMQLAPQKMTLKKMM